MKLRLLHESNNPNLSGLTPDSLLGYSNVTFIYDNKGKLHVSDKTHVEIIEDNIDYFRGLFNGKLIAQAAQYVPANIRDRDVRDSRIVRAIMDPSRRMEIDPTDDILGRVGNYEGKRCVAVWLKKPKLPECVRALVEAGHLKGSEYVCWTNPTLTVAEYVKGGDVAGDNEGDDENVDVRRRLHTMLWQDRQIAQKKLGMAGKSKKRAIAAALQASGTTNPGQKYWAMSSESKR